ncbi:MAG: EI24 domain-containing protein [bacterium]
MIQNSALIQNSLSAWPAGFKYILKNRWIQKYIGLAVVFNFIVFLILIAFSGWLSIFATNFIKNSLGTNLDGFFFLLANFLLWLVLIFFVLQSFSSISSIVNAPIYNLLTAKIIEKELPNIRFPNTNFVLDIFHALAFELKKLALSAVITLILIFINLVPILGSIAYLLIITLQIIFLTGLDAFEPFHSLKKYTFRKRLKVIFKEKYKFWPFLLISGILGNIPFLNIFLTPVSIVGACQIAKEEFKD